MNASLPANPPNPQRIVLSGAILSLVFGLLSSPIGLIPGLRFLPWLKSVTGIPAVVLGFLTVRRINVQGEELRGRSLAIVGMCLGILGIILDVIGFVSMFLMQANLASDKVTSQNNLRMIGQAYYSKHGPDGPYPCGTMYPPPKLIADIPWQPYRPSRRLSWMVTLLPYVQPIPEDKPKGSLVKPRPDDRYGRLYGGTSLLAAWDAEVNHTIAGNTIPAYVTSAHPSYDEKKKPAPTHYVGIAGLGNDAASLSRDNRRAGIMGYDRYVTLGFVQMRAGTRHTSLAVETTNRNGPWIAGGFSTMRGVPEGDELTFGRGKTFGGCFPNSFHLLMLDGSVMEKSNAIAPMIFRAHATMVDDSQF